MVTLRDYQVECKKAVLTAWGEIQGEPGTETYRSVLINLATSAGKTVTAGAIIQAVMDRGRCLFIADTDELCEQPRQKFRKQFGFQPSLEKAHDKASRMAEVVIGSAQTLIREDRLKRFPPDHFKYIFVDEAHRGSDRNKKITDYFQQAKVAGLTATAFRAKLADLSDYYENVVFELGVFDLIDDGYNAPLKVLTLPVQVDLRAVHQRASTEGMDYDKTDLDTTIAPYYQKICELVLEHAADRHIICYLPLIKSSQEFVEIARRNKINARHIDGKSDDRRAILEEFERGEIQLLANSNLLTTGWDSPRCDCLLNLRPTRSVGLFRQMAGRIGRVLPGVVDGIADRDERKRRIAESAKPDALILDLLWQTERFGLTGPADLIAANTDEREAILLEIRRTGTPENLQELTTRVQEEREERLRKALEEAARKRIFASDAVEMVAAILHGRKVLNYEPVMHWEAQPVSEKQKAWLAKQGIDPESAKDRGQASKIMDLLFRRKQKKLASWRAVQALTNRGIAGAIHMTDRQAYDILQGDYPFPFGKPYAQRKTMKQVPASYYAWLSDPSRRDWVQRYESVWDWVKRTTVVDEGECTCIGAHRAPNCPVHPKEAPVSDLFDCLDR